MTPPDPAAALLAEALHERCIRAFGPTRDHGGGHPASDRFDAAVILAHPRLARVMALGLAWVRAEEALPEGWMLGHVGLYANQTWGMGWYVHALSSGGLEVSSRDADLAAALDALADKLGDAR